MVNEHEDQYERSEESEYHFSDDEVGYEVDPDASKPVTVAPGKNPLASLTQSKRMLISLGVFLALVFVVYKMVSPSTTAPSTDITPAAAPAAPTVAPQVAPAPASATVAPATAAPAPTAPTAPALGSPTAPVAATAPALPATPGAMPDNTTAASTAAPEAQPVTEGVQQASMTAPPSAPPGASTAVAMPNMIPVPTTPAQAAAPSMPSSPLMDNIDNRAAQVAATNEQLMAQLQAEYAQRIADYQTQNKNLQDEVQTLNTRVASMETEMSQLIQTLTKQFQNNGSTDGVNPDATAATPGDTSVNADIKLPYSVQAIIPGRAWLRADNGDTLTVAEGDTIKDVGQVTKIDPYDGIVEIKVGNKTVTLSYGNGG